MLLRLLFIFSLSFTAVIFYAGADSPSTLTEEEERAEHAKLMRQKQSLVNQAKQDWLGCESACKNCLGSYSRGRNQEPACNNSAEHCKSECEPKKKQYEKLAEEVANMEKARREAEADKNSKTGTSPLAQVRKKKKNVGLYAIMGFGTTGLLMFKADKCYAKCSASGGGSCGFCHTLAGMAVVAGAASVNMLNKKGELQNIESTLCDSDNCDPDDGDGDTEPPPTFCPTGVPSKFCKPPTITRTLSCPPGDPNCNPCPADDPDCDKKKKKGGPQMPGYKPYNPRLTHGQITGNTGIPGRPPSFGGKYSANKPNPTKAFDYNKLTKAEKKKLNKLLDNLNKEKQAFMEEHGLGGVDTDSEIDDDINELINKGADSQNNNKDLSAAFSKDDDSRSLTSLAGNSVRSKKRPSSLAEQMQNLLKKMKETGKGKNKAGFLGDKSVLIGNDAVGVREDNIFHMVHRMNRKLERDRRFIPSLSF